MSKNLKLTELYFDALAKGDMETVGSLFADDVIWHQPGQGVISGTIYGKENVFTHLGKFMQLSQGTFGIDDVEYITSNGDLVAASIHFKAEAQGKSIAMRGMDIMRFESEKIKEVWLYSEDIEVEDAFWTELSK